MGKNFNPVDAHRKAQRAKELKKNKDARKDKRENQLVKQDTRDIESEIKQLKSGGKPTDDESKARLAELEKQLKHIVALKEKYVKDHPDEKDQIFRPRGQGPRRPRDGDGEEAQQHQGGESSSMASAGGHLCDPKTGRQRDPRRSVYYDAVYNPFGAPPPGMPYREKSIEEESSDEDDEDDDDDIVMPEGPPPGANDSDSDSDDSDDIPLPPGPPPPKAMPPPVQAAPPMYMGFGPPAHTSHARPPPQQRQPFRPPHQQQAPHALPPRPAEPGVISAQPSTITAGPTAPAPSSLKAASTAGTISAEPQLRDLRKEATVFVPRGIKRKKGAAPAINAAPNGGDVDEDGDAVRRKRDDGPDLMSRLQGVLGDTPAPAPAPASASARKPAAAAAGGPDDDYQNFLKGLGDLA